MYSIIISKCLSLVGTVENLPASKSLSNRALIIDALSGKGSVLRNLSEANDTVLMNRLLQSGANKLDAEDAGTTIRFLAAWCAVQRGSRVLTGTTRMKQRPIGILGNALRELGAEVRYLEKEGFPPIEITGLKEQKTRDLSVRSDISSQFISALMMIGPVLPSGLSITFEGRVGSVPYLEMTASLMKTFGASVELNHSGVAIEPKPSPQAEVIIEADWSGAGYWYSFCALAKEAELILSNLSLTSLQADRVAVDVMKNLGVVSEETRDGIRLKKAKASKELTWDFRHCPDLAQTVAVACAATGVEGYFTGLESLRIKETDRIAGLQNELAKLGAGLKEETNGWVLIPSGRLPDKVIINTYDDHRMAMAFAPLATRMDVTIENPSVTRKSYPGYWDDLSGLGFNLTELPETV